MLNQYAVLQEITQLFQKQGNAQYGGEAVTQLEHALQSGHLARKSKSSPALVVAALLHDVGHLLHDLPADAPSQGIEDHHEDLAAKWLVERFGNAVAEPARLHVAAKRYLFTVEPAYQSRLSAPSLLSLELQGGRMTDEEVHEFRQSPYFQEAVLLRRWDDTAKFPGLEVPGLEDFYAEIQQVLKPSV